MRDRPYQYSHYYEIPEGVRREFTVAEIIELELCPPETCPAVIPEEGETPQDLWWDVPAMLKESECSVCGVIFKRPFYRSETPAERVTCGSVLCTATIMEWLETWNRMWIKKRKPRNDEEDLLTFLNSDVYAVLRYRFLQEHER